MNNKSIQIAFHLVILTGLFVPTRSQAAGVVWNQTLTFSEFEGKAGGFDDDKVPVLLQNRNNPGPNARSYDVLAPAASTGGGVGYAVGQDQQADLTMKTQVIENNGDRWNHVNALKRRNGYMADINIESGTSRSGDFGIVAFEISLNANLQVDARNFGARVSSANSLGEIYEWTFVTIGGIEDAPFDVNRFNDYNALVYNDLSTAGFLNPDGSVKLGGAGTGDSVSHGKTISQFLAGEPAGAAKPDVKNGWYAMDQANVNVLDGPETAFTNPGSGTGDALDHTITGSDLGLNPEDKVTKFTVWFGYYDVGFDTNGDGFTLTNSNQDAWITRINLGSGTVPEPSGSMFLGLTVLALLGNRRRSVA